MICFIKIDSDSDQNLLILIIVTFFVFQQSAFTLTFHMQSISDKNSRAYKSLIFY